MAGGTRMTAAELEERLREMQEQMDKVTLECNGLRDERDQLRGALQTPLAILLEILFMQRCWGGTPMCSQDCLLGSLLKERLSMKLSWCRAQGQRPNLRTGCQS